MTDMQIKILETVIRKSECFGQTITLEKDSAQDGHSTDCGIDVLVVDAAGNGNGDYVKLYSWEKIYEVIGN